MTTINKIYILHLQLHLHLLGVTKLWIGDRGTSETCGTYIFLVKKVII